MPAPFLTVLQFAVAIVEPLPEPPLVIDLIAPVRLLRCPEARGEEIIVCGQRPGEEDRLFFRRDPWGRTPARPKRRGGLVVPF